MTALRALLMLVVLFASACSTHTAPGPAPAIPSEPVVVSPGGAGTFPNGCVAADHAVASEAGARMLALGGNAVDAAVAASFALSVVRPYSCGIGGGGFMVIHVAPDERRPRGRDLALNYRETTPAGIDPRFYERHADPDASTRGATAAAIPGTVAGLLQALEAHGTLDRATVLAPAIAAARDGFAADEDLVRVARDLAERFEKNPAWKARFSFVWTRYLREGAVRVGDRITNPEQAAALELIARDGAAAFYRGAIADAIVESSRADGGVITHADLAGYRPAPADPLRFAAFDGEVISMPPPSSGGLAMAEALGIRSLLPPADGALGQHLLVESVKHAFADRAEWLADPAFEPVPVKRLLSASYLGELASRVSMERTLAPERYGSRRAADPPSVLDDGGTSHLCAVDRFGNGVACTETINLEFGSLLAVEGYGFCLNNEMDDFLTRRGEPNAFGLTQSERNLPAPGKRPLSSMTPSIVLRPDARGVPCVVAIAGASGGPRIITATAQALINGLAKGMSAGEAVRAPRLHHQWMPDTLVVERAYRGTFPDIVDRLEQAGHAVKIVEASACVQMIRRSPGGPAWEAGCDPRKGGRPAGH